MSDNGKTPTLNEISLSHPNAHNCPISYILSSITKEYGYLDFIEIGKNKFQDFFVFSVIKRY